MCCPVRQTLLDFAADRLSVAQATQLTDHLAWCIHCQSQLEQVIRDEARFEMRLRSSGRRSVPESSGWLERLYELRNTSSQRANRSDALDSRTRDEQRSDVVAREQLKHIGRFELHRRLGRGGFAAVYLAYDPQRRGNVALKVPRERAALEPALVERFLREGRASAALQHPNILPVYEAGQADGIYYLAMAHCDGPDLARWLSSRHQPLDTHSAAQLMLQLTEAVGHAHQQGILHRDIKPSNVLLDIAPESSSLSFTAKLSDFGLALLADTDAITVRGELLGTPEYMAPEQALGLRERLGPATDIYGLGALLYQLLTCRPPFSGSDAGEVLRLVTEVAPVPPREFQPSVSSDLEAICLKCLRKDVHARYVAAADLAADLRLVLQDQPLSVPVAGRRASASTSFRSVCVSIANWIRRAACIAGPAAQRIRPQDGPHRKG